ncbi:MAG: GGDEF domain-containing protein [Alphaproteobacteria bacterium]|nr:GGDEF domain-containing protein [Alphaproteobacteria bacterium]
MSEQESEDKMLEIVAQNVRKEIEKLMLVVEQSAKDAKNYDSSLTDFSGSLQSSTSMEQIKQAVLKVARETQVMAAQNQKLQDQLSHAAQDMVDLRSDLDKVRKDSLTDPLTGIGNRAYFSEQLAHVLQESRETGTPVSLLMADIDHFKKFNDNYGHLIGDEVLKLVAKTLVENLKGRDIIARYGGEEFVIILPHTTVQDAARVADSLRDHLSTKQIRRRKTHENLGIVTISLGAAQYKDGEDPQNLIDRADLGLYAAKQAGRNKVVVQNENN